MKYILLRNYFKGLFLKISDRGFPAFLTFIFSRGFLRQKYHDKQSDLNIIFEEQIGTVLKYDHTLFREGGFRSES